MIALENPGANGLALSVGGGEPVSVLHFATLVIAESGADVEPVVPGAFRVGDTRPTASDISRMRALGWEPTEPVRTSVLHYLDLLDTQSLTCEYLEEAERVMADTGVIQHVHGS